MRSDSASTPSKLMLHVLAMRLAGSPLTSVPWDVGQDATFEPVAQ